jgi:hypothetical protein
MNGQTATFWLAALMPGVFGFVWNILFRLKKGGILATSGADWILLIAVFDATALCSLDQFQKLILDTELKSIPAVVFVSLLLGSLILWAVVIEYLEPRMTMERRQTDWIEPHLQRQRGVLPYALFFVVWTVTIALTAAHILVFTWKSPV